MPQACGSAEWNAATRAASELSAGDRRAIAAASHSHLLARKGRSQLGHDETFGVVAAAVLFSFHCLDTTTPGDRQERCCALTAPRFDEPGLDNRGRRDSFGLSDFVYVKFHVLCPPLDAIRRTDREDT